MGKEFLGRGWAFPLRPEAGGGLAYVEAEQDIEQALEIILLTRPGERPMRPDFGCAVSRYVFAPGSARYLGLVEDAVRAAIIRWEPRVELLGVRASVDEQEPSRVLVAIDYLVRRTNTRHNRVFPFYLGTEGGL